MRIDSLNFEELLNHFEIYQDSEGKKYYFDKKLVLKKFMLDELLEIEDVLEELCYFEIPVVYNNGVREIDICDVELIRKCVR